MIRLATLAIALGLAVPAAAQYARDPKQPVDADYAAKMKEYTTAPYFTSPLVDYLPASKTVPTPKAVLGDVAGAPGRLPYSKEVYAYMRMVEKASPRVKVYSIGTTEEGREMIAVAVSSEANLAALEVNRARLAKLADPRTIQMNDTEAEKLVAASVPVYYITGTILSIYAFDGPIFGVSSFARGGGRFGGGGDQRRRPTGRGTAEDPDQPQGRPPSDPAPEDPRVEPWQAAPVQDEQLRNGVNIIPPAWRPRVVLRYGDNRDLLVSGLLDGGTEIAQRPMVVDVPVAKGHVVLFSNNPVWRGETRGSYFLVFNAILNHDSLNAGRVLDKQ